MTADYQYLGPLSFTSRGINMATSTVLAGGRDNTAVQVVNDVTETSLFSYTLPASTLGPDRVLRLTMSGDYLVNNGTNRVLTLRFKFGATEIWEAAITIAASDADRAPWFAEFLLAAINDDAIQRLSGIVVFGLNTVAPAATGEGAFSASHQWAPVRGAAIEDSAGDLVIDVTAEWGTAHASIDITKESAVLELL